jgi:hypothetical protein
MSYDLAVGRDAAQSDPLGHVPIQALPVTTLDMLKLAAVLLMVSDHLGLYFLDGNGWRIAGRPVAAIFGFLIGFSGKSRVPIAWIAMGLGLTLLAEHLDDDGNRPPLDVLITLALTRVAVPALDSLHRRNPLLLIIVAACLAGITQWIQGYVDYGAEIAVAAIVGVAVRLNDHRATDHTAIAGTVLIAATTMSLLAIKTLELSGTEAWATGTIIAATFLLLALFRKAEVPGVPPRLRPGLRWIGRNTLAIYAVHLALFQIVVFAHSTWAT